jgi:Restriction endonuclease
MNRPDPEWRMFEKAVATFATTMDPSAQVRHNPRLPDRHHHGQRQRDVWIEAKLCGHFPVSALVSCKRLKRKLHSGDVDAFNGELASSQAHLGVLYSYSGFSRPAIEKGRALGIPCCRLYIDQAPELPEVLPFISYCCAPQLRVNLPKWPVRGWELETWEELFRLPLSGPSGDRTVLSELVSRVHAAEAEAVRAVPASAAAPQAFGAGVVLNSSAPDADALEVHILGQWKFYRGRLEAHRVRGSYEFTHGDLRGEVATPWIDRLGAEPGPGWERVEQPSSSLQNTALIILYKGNAEEALMASLGPQALASGA